MPEIRCTPPPPAGSATPKVLLDREGLAFEQIDVTTDAEARDALAERTGRTTVPQIFVDGRAIGGFEELAALVHRRSSGGMSQRDAA